MQARTAAELRIAPAVLLPLEAGLSLAQTALVLGRSRHTTCALRTDFCARASGLRAARRKKSELRNRAKNTLQAEAAALDAALAGAAQCAVLVIPGLKEKIEDQLGHSISLAGVYRMLARHGWRKVAPDTEHPQGNAQAREEWKKTPVRPGASARPIPQAAAPAGDVSGRGAVWPHRRLAPVLVQKAFAPDGQSDAHARVRVRLRRCQPCRWTP